MRRPRQSPRSRPSRAKPKRDAAPSKRMLATGVRKAGEPDYTVTLYPRTTSPFPPLLIKMTLHELQSWLRETQSASQDAPGRERPGLRIVG